MKKQLFKRWLVRAALAIFALTIVRLEAQVLTLIPTAVSSEQDSTGGCKAMTISAASEKPTGIIALTFKSDAMLPGETIANVALVMSIKDDGSGAEQNIKVYAQKSGNVDLNGILAHFLDSLPENNVVEHSFQVEQKSYSYTLQRLRVISDFSQHDSRVRWEASSENWAKFGVDLKKGFTLFLAGTGGGLCGRQFHGLKASEAALEPRLIVEYTSGDQPTVAQPAYVQSPVGFLPSAQPQSSQSLHGYKTVPLGIAPAHIWSYTPAFYNNCVYFLTIDDKGIYYVSWRRPLWAMGGQIPISGPAAPGHHLLISKSGRLYIVGEEIIAYSIRPDGTPEPRGRAPLEDASTQPVENAVVALDPKNAPTLSTENASTQPVENAVLALDPQHAPTLNTDGSLFYVATSVQRGVRVIGRNPDLQELWSVAVEGPASRVTLGPSGQYVYVTTEGDGLVTIDARTGDTFTNCLPAITPPEIETAGKCSSTKARPSLPTPVVLRQTDGTEKVYVVKNFVKNGVLALFDNKKTMDGGNRRIAEVWKIDKALFGQPLVTKDKVYVVRVDGEHFHVEDLDPSTGTETKAPPPLEVPKDGLYLLEAGNLTVDADGNVFLWNGQTASGVFQGLHASDASFQSIFEQKIGGGLEKNANLFFGTDGTLYAGAQKSGLYAIVPYFSLTGMMLPVAFTSPTNLWIEGEGAAPAVLTGTDNTLAATSVLLGPNFTVEKGTTLTVTINRTKISRDQEQLSVSADKR